MIYRENASGMGKRMDTSGIEPDPSRKFPEEVLSERDNQLHHVPLKSTARRKPNRMNKELFRLGSSIFLLPNEAARHRGCHVESFHPDVKANGS